MDPLSPAAVAEVFGDAETGAVYDKEGERSDFTDITLARSVIAYFQGIAAYSRFFAFLHHHYEPLDDAVLESFLALVIERRVNPRKATDRRVVAVRKQVERLAYRSLDWANETLDVQQLVAFQSGVLEIPALRFRPGRPDDYMTMHLNCDWDPATPPGAIDDFLHLLLQPDEVRPFLEFLGYCEVAGAPSLEAYAILLGAGENGKSRLLQVIGALFRGFTASVPFQDLAKHHFEKSVLFRRMLNLVGDMSLSADLVQDSSVIKTLTGGDTIHADVKFKSSIEFQNRTKFIISSNELFRSNDHTWGFYRRPLIFHLLRDFREGGADGDKRDPRVVDRLLADPNTLPRLARLGVEAYVAMLAGRGRFSESPDMQSAREEFRLANDAVAAFVEDVITEVQGGEVLKEDVYRAFSLWAKATGRGVVGSTKFWQRWANTKPAFAHDSRPKRPDGSRPYVIRGIAFTTDCVVMVPGNEGDFVPLPEALASSRTGGRQGTRRLTGS
jgi:P4 family phage/plasmid primase-like protien